MEKKKKEQKEELPEEIVREAEALQKDLDKVNNRINRFFFWRNRR